MWGAAHLIGWFGPIKSFFLGIPEMTPLFYDKPLIISLTGNENTPRLFGGKDSFYAAAGLGGVDILPQRIGASSVYAVLLRPFFFGYFCSAFIFLQRTFWERMRVLAVSICLLVFFTIISLVIPLRKPDVVDTFSAIPLNENQIARYELTVSPGFIALLSEESSEGKFVEFYFSDPYYLSDKISEPRITIGHKNIPLIYNSMWRADVDIVLDAFALSRVLVLELAPDNAVYLRAWQYNNLLNRNFMIVTEEETIVPEMLPAFEIRIWNTSGILVLAGF